MFQDVEVGIVSSLEFEAPLAIEALKRLNGSLLTLHNYPPGLRRRVPALRASSSLFPCSLKRCLGHALLLTVLTRYQKDFLNYYLAFTAYRRVLA